MLQLFCSLRWLEIAYFAALFKKILRCSAAPPASTPVALRARRACGPGILVPQQYIGRTTFQWDDTPLYTLAGECKAALLLQG